MAPGTLYRVVSVSSKGKETVLFEHGDSETATMFYAASRKMRGKGATLKLLRGSTLLRSVVPMKSQNYAV